jgi:hypothetical protein
MNKVNLTAPCGLGCFLCSCYVDKECKGCLEQKGYCGSVENCATYLCAMGKKVRYCFECTEFPCSKLQPAADKAESYPHNFKMYNLCRMKLVGVESWAENEALEIRQKHFNGKFKVGLGPIID